MLDIFERYHGHADLVEYDISIATETKKADNTTSMFEIQSGLTVVDLISKFEIKNLVFSCKRKEATATGCQGVGQHDYNTGNKLNAFDKLMAPKRKLPPRRQSRWVKYSIHLNSTRKLFYNICIICIIHSYNKRCIDFFLSCCNFAILVLNKVYPEKMRFTMLLLTSLRKNC
jgi:hypothetical protein